MASSLVGLGPELVAHILSFNDSSFLSRPLWITGNLSLQRVLEDGVTYIELRNAEEYIPLKLPKYLTRMRSLRHLIVDRACRYGEGKMHDHSRTLEVVKGLPEALESLVFRFQQSSDIFFPDDPSSTPHASVQSSFPSLQCLILDDAKVWSPAMVSQLPLSLTNLNIRLPPQDWQQVQALMQLLPASLARLALRCNSFDQLSPARLFPLFPSSLVHLRIEFQEGVEIDGFLGQFSIFTANHLSLLPRTLATIVYLHGTLMVPATGHNILNIEHQPTEYGFTADMTGNCANAVPPFIDTMYVRDLDLKKPENSLMHLPPHLSRLTMHRISPLKPKLLLLLPPRLTSFSCDELPLKGFKPKYWPPLLQKLEFRTLDKAENAALLPPLTDLHVRNVSNWQAITHLPRTLSTLRITLFGNAPADTVHIAWPPLLRKLIFYGEIHRTTTFGLGLDPKKAKKCPESILRDERQFKPIEHCILTTLRVSLLPRSLTDLSLSSYRVPASELIWLPPCLTTLRLMFLFTDSNWDPYLPAAISRAQDLLRMAHENENYDFRLLDQQPQVTFFDLMPRTLRLLSYAGPEDLPPIAWSRLPRNLRNLITPQATLHADCVLHFPKNLRFLDTRTTHFTDEHLKSFHTQLQGRLYCHQANSSLSASAALSAPLQLQLYGLESTSEFYAAFQARRDAMANALGDYDELKKLWTEDELYID